MASHNTNLFLSSLSRATFDWLVSLSTQVELALHTVLYEEEVTPRHAHFLTSGLASIVTPMSNGKSVEVGFIGHEGVVGHVAKSLIAIAVAMATRAHLRMRIEIVGTEPG